MTKITRLIAIGALAVALTSTAHAANVGAVKKYRAPQIAASDVIVSNVTASDSSRNPLAINFKSAQDVSNRQSVGLLVVIANRSQNRELGLLVVIASRSE